MSVEGRLKDKVAIITGAASGIGSATAVLFTREGARLVLADVDEKGLKQTAGLISETDAAVVTIKTDVANEGDVKALVERFKDIPEQGPNDIYMLVESLEMIPEGSTSREFVMLLKKAFEKRDYLVIRWLPPSDRARRF